MGATLALAERVASTCFEDLPETIAFPQHPDDQPLPVIEATVDELAFAIIAAEQECSAACCRREPRT